MNQTKEGTREMSNQRRVKIILGEWIGWEGKVDGYIDLSDGVNAIVILSTGSFIHVPIPYLQTME